jgi:hypothetical protein
MPPIRDFAEFESELASAIGQMNKLAMEYRGDTFIESIQRQLKFVYDWTRGGKRPSDENLKKLSFGVMADRAVNDIDPQLAGVLYRLANYLDQWK